MNVFFRSSIFFAVSAMVFIAARYGIDTGPRSPVFDLSGPTGEREHEGEKVVKSAAMRMLFWEQRLMGNPGVDVMARLWQANETVRRNVSYAFDKASMPENAWQELGPWNIAGRMRALAVDPTNPNILYAGAAAGGIWKSTDQGTSWFTVTDTLPLLPVGAITIDPNNPNRIFAGIGEPCVDPVLYVSRSNFTPTYLRSLGILKSENAGASWTLMPWSSPDNRASHRIVVHPTVGDTVLAGTVVGLWKTSNGGRNWSNVSSGNITDVLYKPGDPSRVYIAIGYDDGSSSNGVYVSEAGGRSYSFRKMAKNFPASDSCGRILLGISPADPNRLYAAVALNRRLANPADNDFLAFLSSTNGGETWQRGRNVISSSCTSGQAYFDMAMAVSPTDANLIFIGGLDIYRSTNGGFSFTKLTDWTRQESDPRFAHADHHALVFRAGDGNVVYNGNDGGVSISTDRGGNWTRRVGRLGTIQFYACNFDPSNPTYAYGGTQDNGTLARPFQDNAQWFEVFGGDGGNVAIDPQKPNIRYVVTTPSAVPRAVVRVVGSVPTTLSTGLNAGGNQDRFNWIQPLMLHPNDRTRLYTASQYVYVMRNPDGSNPSWQLVSPDLADPFYIVSDLAVSPTNNNYMYAVTSNGKAWVTTNLLSLDATWTNISSGLPARWLTDITVDWDDPDVAYAAASGFGTGHAYKTTNRGQSWINISGDLPDIPAAAIVRSMTDPNTIFLGTDLGVWYTTDGGAHWKRFGTGMPNVVVFDMKMTPDNRLLVATHGRGMWTTSAVTAIETVSASAEAGFTLAEAFPNPVSGTTAFALTVTRPATVRLELFDAAGRNIRTVFERALVPGTHRLTVPAADLGPGTYFCTASGNRHSITRKFVVIR